MKAKKKRYRYVARLSEGPSGQVPRYKYVPRPKTPKNYNPRPKSSNRYAFAGPVRRYKVKTVFMSMIINQEISSSEIQAK